MRTVMDDDCSNAFCLLRLLSLFVFERPCCQWSNSVRFFRIKVRNGMATM